MWKAESEMCELYVCLNRGGCGLLKAGIRYIGPNISNIFPVAHKGWN